jgi:hypothetical protein
MEFRQFALGFIAVGTAFSPSPYTQVDKLL